MLRKTLIFQLPVGFRASTAKPFSFEPFMFLILKVLVTVIGWCHGRHHTEIPSVCVCSHVAVVLPPDTILMDKCGL